MTQQINWVSLALKIIDKQNPHEANGAKTIRYIQSYIDALLDKGKLTEAQSDGLIRNIDIHLGIAIPSQIVSISRQTAWTWKKKAVGTPAPKAVQTLTIEDHWQALLAHYGDLQLLTSPASVAAGATAGTAAAMTVDKAGNVGIGTGSPSSPGGNKNLVLNATGLSIIKSQGTTNARLDLSTQTGNSYVLSSLVDNGGSPYYQVASGSAVTSANYDFAAHNFRTAGGSNRLQINAAGGITQTSTTVAASPASVDAGQIFAITGVAPVNGVTFSGSDARLLTFGVSTNNSAYMRAANLSILSTNDINLQPGAGNAVYLTTQYVNINGVGTGIYQGLSLTHSKDSSAAQAVSYIDSKNNLGIADSNIFFYHETNGASSIQFSTTANGARNTDRRATAVIIDGNKNMAIYGTQMNVNGGNLLVQHDGTHAYIRSTNASSTMYIGANGSNLLALSSGAGGAFRTVLDNSLNLRADNEDQEFLPITLRIQANTDNRQ